MELTHRKVPPEFLNALPEGIKFVNKHGHDFLIVDTICCPQGHDLMADSVRIHGEPSIRIKTTIGKSEGLIFVDAFWGGHEKLYNFMPDMQADPPEVQVFCPICGADMIVTKPCVLDTCDCNKHIVFTLPGGKNRIYACARLGCPEHHMEITELPEQVAEQVDEINYFGAHDDDVFQGI